jgi:hypothetical protein
MQQESPDQGALGYLKTILVSLIWIILGCAVWSAFLGPKGILVGIGQYVVIRFAFFFERVFAPARKQ